MTGTTFGLWNLLRSSQSSTCLSGRRPSSELNTESRSILVDYLVILRFIVPRCFDAGIRRVSSRRRRYSVMRCRESSCVGITGSCRARSATEADSKPRPHHVLYCNLTIAGNHFCVWTRNELLKRVPMNSDSTNRCQPINYSAIPRSTILRRDSRVNVNTRALNRQFHEFPKHAVNRPTSDTRTNSHIHF